MPKSDTRIAALHSGWLGRFGARDAKISELLTDQEGWAKLQEMELFEAIRLFSTAPDRASQIGAVRAYMEMASMYEALDGLMQEVEIAYLTSLENAPRTSLERVGLIRLRRGEVEDAREIFFASGQSDQTTVATMVGRAGVHIAEGSLKDGEALVARAAGQAKTPDERALVRMAAYEWGVSEKSDNSGYYGQSLDAMESGDLFSAIVSLQMLEEPWREMEAGADIYLYSLFKKVFARMTINTVSSLDGFVADYSEGRARLLIGDAKGGVKAFSKALEDTAGDSASDDAAWLYGPELGREDAAELAQVYMGEMLNLVGKAGEAEKTWKKLLADEHGTLAIARMAYVQASLGAKAPLGDPRQAVEAAIEATLTLKEAALDIEPGGETISALLNVRLANIYQYAAQVAYAFGDADGALDYMDRAHWKRKGNKPSFVNPPAFVIGLAESYLHSGQYASAVDMMFAMSSHFPSSRMAYESLKRLYASKTGGEAPPI